MSVAGRTRTAPAVELSGVARRFGRRWALRGVDLRVEPGEIIALRGRNGSGKTTLLRICSTLLRPTRGGGSVFGLDLLRDAPLVRARVGFLAHDSGLYDDLTAEENLRFAALMTGAPPTPDLLRSALERVGLLREHADRVRGFSSGMRRRLAFARLLVRPPALLLLDEPYASFDEDGIALVNAFAAGVAREGGAALIATHDTTRTRDLVAREVLIADGRIEAELESGSAAGPFAGAR
jgi:heme exporter protein A